MYSWLYLRKKRRLYSDGKKNGSIKIIYIDTRETEEVDKIWKVVRRRIARENRVGWVEDDAKYMVEPFRFFGGVQKERPFRFQL